MPKLCNFAFTSKRPANKTVGETHFVRELSFFTGRGGRLFVINRWPFFSGPPLGMRKKFHHRKNILLTPMACAKKILVSPLSVQKNFWSLPL